MFKQIRYRHYYQSNFNKMITRKKYEDLEKLCFDYMTNNPYKKIRQHAQFFYGYALSITDKIDSYEEYLDTIDLSDSPYKDSNKIRKIYFYLFLHEFDKALMLLNEVANNKKIKMAYKYALELYECYTLKKPITNKFLLRTLPNSLVPFYKKIFNEIMENCKKE